MRLLFLVRHPAFLCALLSAFTASVLLPGAWAATCTTQGQMTAAQRDSLTIAARQLLTDVQRGDTESMRTNTIPAVAADFQGIAASVQNLKPLVQQAAITLETLYIMDGSSIQPNEARTQFFCGSPVVVLTFNGLPAATYALVIAHATGVAKPQQVVLILSQSGSRWLLAGFVAKQMIEADHDGLWYWQSARKYAQTRMPFDAWFYYQIAADLLNPLDSISSPNLQKLQQEANGVRPKDLPGTNPIQVSGQGGTFALTSIDTTTIFGGLDLEVHYTPDPAQAAQLRDPPAARQQVVAVMSALLAQHPELQQAFHGMWIHADAGTGSLFALELPMNGAVAGSQPSTSLSR
jgi:hypothetical protein